MFLHVEVGLIVNYLEEGNFERGLHIWQQLLPEIGVGGWGKVGQAQAKLTGSEISALRRWLS